MFFFWNKVLFVRSQKINLTGIVELFRLIMEQKIICYCPSTIPVITSQLIQSSEHMGNMTKCEHVHVPCLHSFILEQPFILPFI